MAGGIRTCERITQLLVFKRRQHLHRQERRGRRRIAAACTASTMAGGAMPLSRVGGRILATTGPVSLSLKDAYWRKHAEGWHHTPVRPLEFA